MYLKTNNNKLSKKHYLWIWLLLHLANFSNLGHVELLVNDVIVILKQGPVNDLSCSLHYFSPSVSLFQAVELSDCEKTQALALQVLLSLVKHNQHRMHEMACCHGYSMIHQVLMKTKCIVGYHILKVMY